jgi:catechol 2,3-dioxygenase-like lactoylglutathione lyase family enzyme
VVEQHEQETRAMTSHPAPGAIHHLRLTVTDVDRSREFYTSVLGFEVAGLSEAVERLRVGLSPGVVLTNGATFLGLGPAPDPNRATSGDRFDENRVGLDHLSFTAASRGELERIVRILDERGIPHGEITDLGPTVPILVLAFRDPDNIQLEFTAPGG